MYLMLSDAIFFDVLLILATGMRAGFLGGCIGLVFANRRGPSADAKHLT